MSYPTWGRHSYPVQKSYDTNGSQPGSPIFEEAPEVQQQPLPRSVRAVTDANNYHHKGRNLIICLDGTGDKFDADNSNIVHLVSCLKKDDPSQVTYYQSGIGTYDGGGVSNGLNAAADMAVGSGLGVHICDAYKFLMSTYREGDKICLFGFSRGAYTARCLAGMLHKVGLLPAHNVAQVPFAYDFYKDDSDNGWKMSADFKKTFCIDCNVYFVGVFDCVASVGFIPRKMPFSSTPTSKTGHFRHAMALDEHRAKFKVCHWQRKATKGNSSPEERAAKKKEEERQMEEAKKHSSQMPNGSISRNASTRNGTPQSPNSNIARNLSSKYKEGRKIEQQINSQAGNGTLSRSMSARSSSGKKDSRQTTSQDGNGSISRKVSTRVSGKKSGANSMQMNGNVNNVSKQQESDVEKQMRSGNKQTDVLEVWFMGCHADVGGGAVANETRHKLSQIPLRWMIRQCFECDTGILFSVAALAEMGLDVHTMFPLYKALPRPKIGPSPAMLEKWEQGKLVPIKHRSSHYDTIPEEKEEMKDGFDHMRDIDQDGTAREPIGDWTPEQCEDYFDAMAGINDQLVVSKIWWILEFWPIKVRIQQKSDDLWVKKIRGNLGRFRAVQDAEPNLHWTVKQRMYDQGYKPRTRNDRNSAWAVVV